MAQLIGRVEAEVLMKGAAQPGSPQPSSGSPSTPQQEVKPRQDFLRADLTPLTDITPLDVKPTPLPSGQPGAFSSVLSPINAKPIPILMSQHCPGSSSYSQHHGYQAACRRITLQPQLHARKFHSVRAPR